MAAGEGVDALTPATLSAARSGEQRARIHSPTGEAALIETADVDAKEHTDEVSALARARRDLAFLLEIVRIQPRTFALAVSGAGAFALLTIASSFAIGWVIDEVVVPRFDDGETSARNLAIGAALVIGIGILRAMSVVVRRGFASSTQWRVAQHFTNHVVRRYLDQPMSWHNRRADGDLVQRAGVDAETTISVLGPIPFATGTVVLLVFSTAWMLTIDVTVGLVAIIVIPILVGTNVLYERSVSAHFSEAQDHLGQFSAGVHESFEGVQLIKSYGAEERETERLGGLADRVRAARVRAIRLRSWFEALLDVIPSWTNILLVVVGAWRVQSGDMTVGEFSSVVFLFTLLVFPLRLIGYALSELPRSMAAWERIRDVLDEPIEPDPAARIAVAPAGVGLVFDGV